MYLFLGGDVKADKIACEQFCDTLKDSLQANVALMKQTLRPFLMTCKSEELLQTENGPIHISETIGGLALQFGYRSDAPEEKDHKKLNIWLNYFQGEL